MSDLHRHLDTARREHRTAQYPGDLAAEVLPPHSAPRHGLKSRATDTGRRSAWMAGACAGAGAIAAAMMLIVTHFNPPPAAPTTPAPMPLAEAPAPSPLALPAMPSFPRDMALAPPHQSLTLPVMPAMPDFPSLDTTGPIIETHYEETL